MGTGETSMQAPVLTWHLRDLPPGKRSCCCLTRCCCLPAAACNCLLALPLLALQQLLPTKPVFLNPCAKRVVTFCMSTSHEAHACPLPPVLAGQHTLTVTKLTEARYGAAWLQGFDLDPAGSFLPPPPSPGMQSGRRMLFIGDSYT